MVRLWCREQLLPPLLILRAKPIHLRQSTFWHSGVRRQTKPGSHRLRTLEGGGSDVTPDHHSREDNGGLKTIPSVSQNSNSPKNLTSSSTVCLSSTPSQRETRNFDKDKFKFIHSDNKARGRLNPEANKSIGKTICSYQTNDIKSANHIRSSPYYSPPSAFKSSSCSSANSQTNPSYSSSKSLSSLENSANLISSQLAHHGNCESSVRTLNKTHYNLENDQHKQKASAVQAILRMFSTDASLSRANECWTFKQELRSL